MKILNQYGWKISEHYMQYNVKDSQFADETFDKEFMDFKLLQRDNWCLTTEETLNHEFLHNHKKLYF